jgi:Kdo2-lipid IVA lauroyltransferase/acyltransferase
MIAYFFTRVFIESFRLIPFWMLYIISDLTWFILFKVVGYRKKVIYENLEKAFPEKSKNEIKQLAQKFYRNFTDILLESFKGLTMSRKSFLKRFKLLNPEFLDKYYQEGKNVLCLAAHYSNWEWGIFLSMYVKHEAVTVYKTVNNRRLNDFMRERRGRWNFKQISMAKTRIIFNNIEKPKFIVLIADQNTPVLEKAIWINFLGIETPCIHGPEVYSNIFNYPLIFLDFQRVRRGYYSTELSLLSENPKSLEKGEITKKYMGKLEEIIRKKPEDWLWTHKRWKHKKVGDKILKDYYYKY